MKMIFIDHHIVAEETFQRWIDTLRSGTYRQTVSSLNDENGFCCLGVACDLFIDPSAILTKDGEGGGYIFGTHPDTQMGSPKWLKAINDDFHKKTGAYLTQLNDGQLSSCGPFSFDEIADLLQAVYIEKVLE